MSVLIRGMEMPTAGMCKTITIFDDGAVVEGNGSEKIGSAVPVPEHGRLIDADALIREDVKDDKEIAYTKAVLDRELQQYVGSLFVPYDERYR